MFLVAYAAVATIIAVLLGLAWRGADKRANNEFKANGVLIGQFAKTALEREMLFEYGQNLAKHFTFQKRDDSGEVPAFVQETILFFQKVPLDAPSGEHECCGQCDDHLPPENGLVESHDDDWK